MSLPIKEFGEGLCWWALDGDSRLLIGLTECGLEQAGADLALDLVDVGDVVSNNEWLGEVRGRDGSVEILAPRKLVIEEINQALLNEPGLLSEDPTGDGWLLRAGLL
jgi:glycine cleavage system H protein